MIGHTSSFFIKLIKNVKDTLYYMFKTNNFAKDEAERLCLLKGYDWLNQCIKILTNKEEDKMFKVKLIKKLAASFKEKHQQNLKPFDIDWNYDNHTPAYCTIWIDPQKMIKWLEALNNEFVDNLIAHITKSKKDYFSIECLFQTSHGESPEIFKYKFIEGEDGIIRLYSSPYDGEILRGIFSSPNDLCLCWSGKNFKKCHWKGKIITAKGRNL